MKLLLDIGNSSDAWATYADNGYASSGKFFYEDEALAQGLERNIGKLSRPEAILMASVASDEDNLQVCQWTDAMWQLQPWQASVGKQFEQLINSYADCQQMGIDRWLAMVAAWSEFQSALCIIDCGTAVTIDLIDDSGQHLGGYILPGSSLMQQALLKNTDRIHAEDVPGASLGPANNTQQAISHGAGLALVGSIEYVVTEFESKKQDRLQCVMTGGSAEWLINLLERPVTHRPRLVLDGLLRLYETTK